MSEKQRYYQILNMLKEENSFGWAGLLIKRAAKNWPDNIALFYAKNQITYKELYKRSLSFAQHLNKLGIKNGDHIILYYPNSIEFYIAYYAIWLLGAIVAPLNVFLKPEEVLRIIEEAQPSCVIIDKKFLKDLESEKLPQVVTDIEKLSDLETKNPDQIDLKYLEEISIDETAALLYTSGTTGFPKGVMLSSRNIITNISQALARFQFENNERVLCPLPLFHSYPQSVCLWTTTLIGASAVIIPKVTRQSIIQGLEYRPTVIVAVPALYNLFCLLKNLDFSSVKYFFSGGDALQDKTRSYFELIYGRKLCNGYGLTETSPFISVFIDDFTAKTSNIGKAFSDIECQIRNEKNQIVSPSEIGVLWVKGPNIMKGYYKAEEATQSILQNKWFNTGDLAYISSDGAIIISGRQKDLIIHKGINIYPQEIENVLLRHNQVLQAGVIGVSDDEGEVPIAFIGSKTDKPELLEKELKKYAATQLATYKVPREFVIKRELPLTSTGKVDKKQLKTLVSANKVK